MKTLLFLKRFDMVLQVAAAVAPFLVWVALWGTQKDDLLDGVHPLHAYFYVGGAQMLSAAFHLLPVGEGAWMSRSRLAYLCAAAFVLAVGAADYFFTRSEGYASGFEGGVFGVLARLELHYLLALLLVSSVLAVWYFCICWTEAGTVKASVLRNHLIIR